MPNSEPIVVERHQFLVDFKDSAMVMYEREGKDLVATCNSDLETETYHTTWREPGINCETCHGPGAEHVRIFEALKEGEGSWVIRSKIHKKFSKDAPRFLYFSVFYSFIANSSRARI